jgi:hypothetical protein
MADYDSSGSLAYLKHHFREFVKIAFWNAKIVENAFEWPFDIKKHRFMYITKFAFKDFQKTDYEFSRPFHYLKHRFIEVNFFDAQDATTSTKSFFKTSRRQIISSQGHSPT